MKKFSFILCSRNDNYCDDPISRLSNTLNFLGDFLYKLNLLDSSECIVADWGSENNFIFESIKLNNYIKTILKYVLIPPQICKNYNDNSPFSQVHALNCCFRRSCGTYIIKLDQDTILGPSLIHWLSSRNKLPNISFSTRRNLTPIQSRLLSNFIVSQNKYKQVPIDNYHYAFNKIVNNSILPFHGGVCGALVLKRDLFEKVSGFNEELVYQNNFEIDLLNRLSSKYSIYNLGLKLDFDIYHQYHSNDDKAYRFSNSNLYRKNVLPNNNKKNWGLINEKLEIFEY